MASHALLDLHFTKDPDLSMLCVFAHPNISSLGKISTPVFLCFSPLGSGLVIFVVELWAFFILILYHQFCDLHIFSSVAGCHSLCSIVSFEV